MSFIDRRTGKKAFRLRGDSFEQSLVNHEHPNEFLFPLEKRRPSVETSLSQFQHLADSWFQQIKRFKAHRETGFTFYFCADVYNICMVSVVAGHHPRPIYGGSPKCFGSLREMLEDFAETYPTHRWLGRNHKKIFKQIVEANGDWKKVAKTNEIKPQDLKAWMFHEFDWVALERCLTTAKIQKLKSQCVLPWDYAIHVLETQAGQELVIVR